MRSLVGAVAAVDHWHPLVVREVEEVRLRIFVVTEGVVGLGWTLVGGVVVVGPG